jgi:hypothetical protein
MPIRVNGQPNGNAIDEPQGAVDTVLDLGDGEALFELLCTEIRALSTVEQLEVLNAFQAGGWSALPPHLKRRFERVAGSYLDGGGL